jgi:hypothetical protein
MAIALREYRWDYIAPGATVGLFLHPFSEREVVAFSINVSRGNRPGFTAIAELRVGEVQEHVDGIARTLWVTNKSVSNGGPPTPVVMLNSLVEFLA